MIPPNAPAPDCLSRWFDRLSSCKLRQQLLSASDSPKPPINRDLLLLTIGRAAMACEWEVLLNQHQYPKGAELATQALDTVEQMENELSVFRTQSDISTINRFAASRPIPVSHSTFEMLELAADVYELTAGTFDITAGSLSQAWGFSRRSGRMPNADEIESALQIVGQPYIELNQETRQVKLTKAGVTLNSGAIGKGYALDLASRRLIQSGIHDLMMHGGLSSVIAYGDRQHRETGGGWLVGLKHPWRWEEHLGTIRLRDQALGTSGSGKQFFHFEGKRYSHIIDPRSGWPAQGMMSTTVVCPSAAVADALATALFVMGPDDARGFCEAHPEVGLVMIYTDPKSGSLRLERINIAEDAWIAAGNGKVS
jgi:FAD:protein FMN transferase